MKTLKNTLGALAAIVLLSLILVTSACAAGIVYDGGVPCSCGVGDAHNMVSWTLDSEGNLEIRQNSQPSGCTAWYQFAIAGDNYGQWKEFLDAHGKDVINVNVGKINKIQYNGSSSYGIFADMTSLKTVRFAKGQVIARNWGKGIFEGCTSLSSVVFGTDAFVPGIIDLSGAGTLTNFTQYGFKNCVNIKKVTLPTCVTDIGQEMFYAGGDNSSLEEVVCLGKITKIGEKAFRKCVSLNSLTFENSDFTIASKAFEGWHNWNLKVRFNDGGTVLPSGFPVEYDEANGVYGSDNKVEIVIPTVIYDANEDLPEGMVRSLNFIGYQVRTSEYNGLRSIYVKDNNVANSGYTLKEYGAILVAGKYKDELNINWNDGSISFSDKVAHAAIGRDGSFADGAKILTNGSEIDPSVSNGTFFAYSIVNYEDNMDTAVYSAGYEVWLNNETESAVIILTDLRTNRDIREPTVSYYEVGLGLYKNGSLNSSVDKESIVWNDMVKTGAVILNAGTDYLNVHDETKDQFTKDTPTDLDGEPFVDTFTLANVPIVKKTVKESVLMLTEKSGLNYSIFCDGENYTLIYKLDAGVSSMMLPSIGAYGNSPMNHQFINKWYGNLWDTDIPAGYSSVSSSRPQPLILNDNLRTKITTVVADKGITGAANDAFFRLGATDYTVSTDFKTLSGSPFANAEGLTTFMTADCSVPDGTVDFSHLTSVGSLGFSSGTGVNFTTLVLPSTDNVPETVTNKTDVLCKVKGSETDDIYVPSNYSGTGLDAIKSNSSGYRFFFTSDSGWVQKIWNGTAWADIDSEEAVMRSYNEHLFGTSAELGEVMYNSQNWEIKIFGTEGKTDTNINLSIGNESFTVTVPEALRCEKLAAMGSNAAGAVQRYTKRENFSYCPVTNVAYIADYVSIKSTGGNVSAELMKFDASSSYDSSTKTYNTITYTESELTLAKVPESTVLSSNVSVTNANGLYMEVIYTSGRPDTEAVEFTLTKELTKDNSGLNSIARNFAISADGKTAYVCTNNSWQQNSDDKGMGAWLLEITGYDTASPTVSRKVLLNNLGKCTDLIAEGLLSADSHGAGCPGRSLQEMGRACTGVVENGDYIYAVERYTGAFDIGQRLTNLGKTDTAADDGVHGHGISYLCVIRKSDFKIEKQILLKNDATSVEINPYDGLLYVMEMTRNWSVYSIEVPASPVLIHSFSQNGEFGGDDPEKVKAYALGSEYIEYQRATFWTDGENNNYLAMSAFSGGVTIWNITDAATQIPTREAHFDIKTFNNGIYGRHVFDVAAAYPYLYITVGGTINYRFSAGNVSDGVIAIDVRDLSKVGNDKSVATHVGIPFEDESDRCNEGDPAPSRIVVSGDILMVNYSDKGVAFFRIGDDGIPVYDRCQVIGSGVPQTMRVNPANGNIAIINGEGHVQAPGMYEIKITK